MKGNLKWEDLEASTSTSIPLTMRECVGHLVGAVPCTPETPQPILDKSDGSLWYLTYKDTGVRAFTGKPSAINPKDETEVREYNYSIRDDKTKRKFSRGKIGGCVGNFYLTKEIEEADMNVYLQLAKLYIEKRTDSDIVALKLKPPMISFIDPSESELKQKIAQRHEDNAQGWHKSQIDPKLTSRYLKAVGGSRRKDEWKNKEFEHLAYLLEENYHFIAGHFKGGKREIKSIMGQNVAYFDLDEGLLPSIEEVRDLLINECGIHPFMGYYTLSATEGKLKQRHFFLLDRTFRSSEAEIYRTWVSKLMRAVEEKIGIKNDQATETLGFVAFARNPDMNYYIQSPEQLPYWYPVKIEDEVILEAKGNKLFK